MSLEDKQYVEGVLAGDPGSFERLVEKYNRMGGAIAYGVLGDYQRAEDVVQEAFFKAFRALGKLRDPARFKVWFAEIVRTDAIDKLRRRRERPLSTVDASTLPQESPFDITPEDEQARRETLQKIHDALRTLGEEDRIVLVLKHMEGLSYKEIAEVTGSTVSAVESRLFRARRGLRKKLGSTQMRER